MVVVEYMTMIQMEQKSKARLPNIIERVFNFSEARVRYFAKVTPFDRFVAASFLKWIPSKVTPNQITLFRFITIPIIVTLLITDHILVGTILFLFSAFSDAVDGALARTTNHITIWGTLCDPVVDKLLIGSVSIILVTKYISGYLALAIVLIELALVASSYFRYKGKVVPAKLVGKVKMVLQCFGIIFLLYYALSGAPILLILATYTLYAAVAFALASLLVYRSI